MIMHDLLAAMYESTTTTAVVSCEHHNHIFIAIVTVTIDGME